MVLNPRGAGDGFVECSCGGRHWGRFGAAGLLVQRDGAVLMQHRAPFLQEGGTWAAPGGALDAGESAVSAALREAQEEAAVPPNAVRPRHAWTVDHGSWAYTTVVADAGTPFEARDVDGEGLAVRWVRIDDVDDLPLHSGFAAAWPQVRSLLSLSEAVLVAGDDAAARDVSDLLSRTETSGLPTPNGLLATIAGRTRAWPEWMRSPDPTRHAADLVAQGWAVTVVSDEKALPTHDGDENPRVVGTAAALAALSFADGLHEGRTT